MVSTRVSVVFIVDSMCKILQTVQQILESQKSRTIQDAR